MGATKVLRFAAVVAAAVVFAAATALTLAGPASASVPAQDVGFTVSGEVDSLFPGATTTLPLQVTNAQPFTIRVTAVETTVHDASAGCPASLLGVGPVQSPVDVAAGATGTVPIEVRLDGSASNACQGVAFPLDFVVTAVEAGAGSAGGSVPTDGGGSPAGGGSPTGLAFTGATIGALTAIGLALITGGVLARRVARSRRAVAS